MTDAPKTDTEKLDFILEKVAGLDDKIDPIVAAYDSVLVGKKFIVGFAGFVTVVIMLGGFIIYAAGFIKHYISFH